jgi:hypothetical protein
MAELSIADVNCVGIDNFSHSNFGQHQLKAELKSQTDKRGIQAGNATRFSTFSTHAKSIARCFDAIQRCLVAGTIKFNTAAVSRIISTVWYAYINKIVRRLPP